MHIRFDHGPDGQDAVFASPRDMLVAKTADQVIPVLADLDAARRDGAWVAGYATYEAGYALEPRLHALMPQNRRLPLLSFGVYDPPSVSPSVSPSVTPRTAPSHSQKADTGHWAPRWDEARYSAAFDAVRQAIGAGDIYQANLTFPLDGGFHGTPQALFAALRARQPVGHGALVLQPGLPALLSRSPELFFKTDAKGRIETRPMKGTMPRDIDPQRDRANRAFLQNDEKNRAENLMIVDLLRNDISRVAQTGSVQVPELFRIESYATVHQMVSTVTAQLQPGLGLADIFAALFPCGSITGAPKIRAMEILRQLEPWPRDIYCGSIGWMAPDGRSQFNVAIRTLMVEDGRAVLNVGGGVVWDSQAPNEYEEALWKTRFAQPLHPSFQTEPS